MMNVLLLMAKCMLSHFSHVQLFCDRMDCSPLGKSVYEISQARTLKWVAISFSSALNSVPPSSDEQSLTHGDLDMPFLPIVPRMPLPLCFFG